jgi:DNA end-binding protein Ku
MARAIWSGVMSFGLVSVPVEIYSATEAHEPSFHQFERGTNDRIRYQRVNERTGKEVDYGDIVKGAEVSRGKYVMIEQDELDAVAPGRSRSLEIQRFVDLDEIDPIHFAKSYYLGPNGDEAKKPYALLRDAMARANRGAIASFVMRGKEYLATVRADKDVLVLETMFFADEIRDPKDEIGNVPSRVKVSPQELKMAGQLIESMAGPWNPKDYRDTYTDRVNRLIRAKAKNKTYEPADEAPQATNVVDLTEALRASVDAARKGGRSGSTKSTTAKSTTAKKTTATKTAAKKSTGRKTAAKKTTAKKTTAKKTAAKKSTAKKSTAKKSTAKKSTAKKAS